MGGGFYAAPSRQRGGGIGTKTACGGGACYLALDSLLRGQGTPPRAVMRGEWTERERRALATRRDGCCFAWGFLGFALWLGEG